MTPLSSLSDPPPHATRPEYLVELRSRAASRLTGAAATKGPAARAVDALNVLHALASSPKTASDALTLLHELQVHQVELDLQAQELHESRVELETALRRQLELYDHQPVGCFTVDHRMVLQELNATGADMLGLAHEEVVGLALDTFLPADSAARLGSAIARVGAGAPRASRRITLRPRHGAERPVLASIGKDPAGDRYLVSLAEAEDEGDDTPPSS